MPLRECRKCHVVRANSDFKSDHLWCKKCEQTHGGLLARLLRVLGKE